MIICRLYSNNEEYYFLDYNSKLDKIKSKIFSENFKDIRRNKPYIFGDKWEKIEELKL